MPKITTQGRPVLLVDAFAGPGKFEDGGGGSPLIICQTVRKATAKHSKQSVPIKVMAIESDPDLFTSLDHLLQAFPFADAVQSSFTQELPGIERAASDQNVFLYIDSFTVEGLQWKAMDKLFSLVSNKTSIEVLLNFNSCSFVRRALAAVKLPVPSDDAQIEDIEQIDIEFQDTPSSSRLDAVVGGAWWQEVIRSPLSFPEQVTRIATTYCDRLRDRFHEVCYHAVLARPHHKVPKYYLVFGSRHPDALRLMNDEMVKSTRTLAEMARPEQPTLFEMRPEKLVPDMSKIRPRVLDNTQGRCTRGDVIIAVIREDFGTYLSKDIRGEIQRLLKAGTLKSDTGHWRINDTNTIWRTP